MTTTTETLELFPGVHFLKDTTKPLGNQWCFFHEGAWLIAKLAYADDLFLDNVAKVIRERDQLAQAMTRLQDENASLLGDAARWRAVIGCARVRALGCAGLTSDVDPRGKPHGNYGHIGLELWTIHDAGSDPTAIEWFTKFADKAVAVMNESVNFDLDRMKHAIAGERHVLPEGLAKEQIREHICAQAKAIREKAAAEPVADADRKCHDPGCWLCEGTGLVNGVELCDLNGKKAC